jgi:hypothetical protein
VKHDGDNSTGRIPCSRVSGNSGVSAFSVRRRYCASGLCLSVALHASEGLSHGEDGSGAAVSTLSKNV